MRLETKKYLLDIQHAAALASEFVLGRTFAGYAEVDHRVVWDVVTTKVPTLTAEVSALLTNG